MKQPEALRLAGILEMPSRGTFERHTAAELRRLHEANQAMLSALKGAEPMLVALLDNITHFLPEFKKMPALDDVRAAIAKGEQQ